MIIAQLERLSSDVWGQVSFSAHHHKTATPPAPNFKTNDPKVIINVLKNVTKVVVPCTMSNWKALKVGCSTLFDFFDLSLYIWVWLSVGQWSIQIVLIIVLCLLILLRRLSRLPMVSALRASWSTFFCNSALRRRLRLAIMPLRTRFCKRYSCWRRWFQGCPAGQRIPQPCFVHYLYPKLTRNCYQTSSAAEHDLPTQNLCCWMPEAHTVVRVPDILHCCRYLLELGQSYIRQHLERKKWLTRINKGDPPVALVVRVKLSMMCIVGSNELSLSNRHWFWLIW